MTSRGPVHYSKYLELERLLSSQNRESEKKGKPAHDEMLFIVVHQVYELWFKQILFEIDSILEMFGKHRIDEQEIGVAVARLERVIEIEKILIEQLRVLETMTPLDFLEFRDLLVPVSGFQSQQFRELESKLGVDMKQLPSRAPQPTSRDSLFSLIERWLERTPFLDLEGFQFWNHYREAVEKMLSRDEEIIRTNEMLPEIDRRAQLEELAHTRESFDALFDQERHEALREKGERRLSFRATHAALLIHLYRDQPILHLPFRLLTALVDIDELFSTWRYRHALMAFRMIGTKIGTGGSSGAQYLRATVESRKVFSDITNLSTFLIPRASLPKLPDVIVKRLGFTFTDGGTR